MRQTRKVFLIVLSEKLSLQANQASLLFCLSCKKIKDNAYFITDVHRRATASIQKHAVQYFTFRENADVILVKLTKEGAYGIQTL
jgi:hypothetical protein